MTLSYQLFNCCSEVIKDAWDDKKSSFKNLADMGLANDPNKVIKIPNFKQEKLKQAKEIVSKGEIEQIEEETTPLPVKKEVAEILEKEAKAPRERRFMYV